MADGTPLSEWPDKSICPACNRSFSDHPGIILTCRENQRLREALKQAALALDEAHDSIISWGGYASSYFQQKHEWENDIKDASRAAVAAHEAAGG